MALQLLKLHQLGLDLLPSPQSRYLCGVGREAGVGRGRERPQQSGCAGAGVSYGGTACACSHSLQEPGDCCSPAIVRHQHDVVTAGR
jgi:hypothetical protein